MSDENKVVVTEDGAKKAHGVENFLSLLADGIRPLPDIVDKMWYFIKQSIELTEAEDEVASDYAVNSAVVLGWVLGLSENEVNTLITAECIKYFELEDKIARYREKAHERLTKASENIRKRKEAEDIADNED